MKKIALFLTAFMALFPVLSCVAEVERSAEITSPGTGEEVYGMVDFRATLIDDDNDNVSWAVRKGTCAAKTGTVLGNVDGHSDSYSWSGSGDFVATADTTSWGKGAYCFVFNPLEDAGESNIRLTREFEVVDEPVANTTDPEVEILQPADDETVSGSVDIRGSVQDDNLKGYALTIRDHDNVVVEIINNSDGISFTDESLFVWDTTAVDNGMYFINLEAEDDSGNEDFDLINVKVKNKLHLKSKNQYKRGGWRDLGFRNQGSCVSYIQSNEHAGKRR
ncbi:MAG: hypothetical protein PHI66_00425 [Candidatus Pacebacteria bacterium]|nr:hypothetical protein [Candidatus Paceibacterota bacterium]